MKEIFAYCKGTLINIEEVPDSAFAGKMLGDGVAIIPNEKEKLITAPFDAEITMVTDTKHAIGMTDVEGNEFLVHIGIDTVNLNGAGLKNYVSEGDKIKQGDKIAKVDWKRIKKAGCNTHVILVNTDMSIENLEKSDQILCDGKTVIAKY